MPKPTSIPDPADSWAEVELYRWQHGHLPGEPGTQDGPLDPVAGLRAMVAAFETRDVKKFPDPFNTMMVLKYVANLLEKKG